MSANHHMPLPSLPCYPCPYNASCCAYGVTLSDEEAAAIEAEKGPGLVYKTRWGEWRTRIKNKRCALFRDGGCTIHDRVLIGMGALLLNGAEIGEDSIVAAGTLVPEEKKFPPRSLLIGRPAVLKRELTDHEVATIRDYAQRYIGYRQDYMSQDQRPASAKAPARSRRSAQGARKGG